MIWRRGWVVAWVATATAASAQPAPADDAVTSDAATEPAPPATPEATLVARGEQLARTGEFSRAIAAFKQAEQLHPSAANACRIGLAYTRRELWSQAELFFARCKARATATDPTPPWLEAAETALTGKLAEIDAARIDVRVDAPGALISISSFPPDEKFAPRAIHLSPGNYMIVASAPEREPATVAIEVEARTAQIVTLVLPHPPPPPPPPPTRDQKIGRALLFTAVGAAVVAVAAHGLGAYERSQLDDARTANDPVAWDQHAGSFERDRAIAIGGYTIAIAAAITGAILHSHGPEDAPAVTGRCSFRRDRHRVAAMKYVALIVVVTGCFSEPARPHGIGPPIVAGSIVRHEAVVGDLNGDGYDDLVLFGNDIEPRQHPTLFVYFGGESLENPDLRIDVTIVPDDPTVTTFAYEVLEATIAISADRKTRGIAAMVAESRTDNGLYVYSVFVPFEGRTPGAVSHGWPTGYAISSLAPDSGDYVAAIRDTAQSLPAHEMLFGGRGIMFAAPAPIDPDHRPEVIGFDTGNDTMQAVIVLPPTGPSEDLLYVGELDAYRTTGDRDSALGDSNVAARYPTGNPVLLAGTGHRSIVRSRVVRDHVFVVTNAIATTDLPIIDVPPSGDPVSYQMTPTSAPDDLAIANVGGADSIDVVALESGTLGVYRDFTLVAPGFVAPATTIGSRDELAGYDVLAVGNFHGSDQLEIYATSDVHPESRLVCYHLNDQLDPCAEE